MTVEPTAIAIAQRGGGAALAAVVERLRAGGIKVTVTDELGAAATLARQAPQLPCLLLDLEGDTEIEDRRRAAETIRKACALCIMKTSIAVTARADAAMIVACIRAGAGDVLDLQLEGTGNAPALLGRVWERQHHASRAAQAAGELRAVVEDLLKALIKTERRSLALEDQVEPPPPARDPAVLIVEHDREIADLLADNLEDAGITSYAYVSGEDAARQAARLGVDLAVLDSLDTVLMLREHAPALPAFLLTGTPDPELASRAAEVGVVGLVQKPLIDPSRLVEHLAQLAREGLARNREQTYLERIKERHEHVLARYRSLPRDA